MITTQVQGSIVPGSGFSKMKIQKFAVSETRQHEDIIRKHYLMTLKAEFSQD